MAKRPQLLSLALIIAVIGGMVWWLMTLDPEKESSAANPPATPTASVPAPAPMPIGGAPQPDSGGAINESLTYALEAADPYTKNGFTVREDYWGGDLPVKETKAITQQLYKGNTYWFWMGTDLAGAKVSVHLYDSDGRLAEAESWQKPHKAAARVAPQRTGIYYLIVQVEQSPAERSSWALAYGFH